jgi:hypothetical protein
MGGLSDFCKEAKALSLAKPQSDARLVGTTGQAHSAIAQPLDELEPTNLTLTLAGAPGMLNASMINPWSWRKLQATNSNSFRPDSASQLP